VSTPDGRLRVGLLATHPIQYQVPWFQALARQDELDLTVFYCLLPTPEQQGVEFGLSFTWDLPLLSGYRYERLENVARVPSTQTFSGCDTPTLGARLRTAGIEALIVNGWQVKSCLQGLRACRRRGLPCLVRGDSNALRARPWPLRLAHRLLLRQYAACLSVGQANAAFYRANGVPEERLFFAPHCVDNARFEAQAAALTPQRADVRAGFGLAPDAQVALFCGKLIAKKRPLELLDALAALRAADPQAAGRLQLLMVGEGALRAECEARVRAAGLPVRFAGFLNQNDIARAYVAADVLVLPSDHGETWGLVVNEAMACGRAAIVSDRVGCHPDLIVPGRTGEVVPFGDLQAWTRALAQVALDAAGWHQRGQAARTRVAGYSLDRLVSGTLHALRYALARPGAGHVPRPG
jgi:glycosyltransferase involved in cell wall biosynthesis